MTNQEVFNKVWQYFIVEKHSWSVDPDGNCRYRSIRGDRCAIGCLIPDEAYTPLIEGRSVDTLHHISKYLPLAVWWEEEMKDVSMKLLNDLQEAHDDYYNNLDYHLRGIAHIYGLEVPK